MFHIDLSSETSHSSLFAFTYVYSAKKLEEIPAKGHGLSKTSSGT